MTIDQIRKEIGMRIANLEFADTKIDLNEYLEQSQLLAAFQIKAGYAAKAEELRDLLKIITGDAQ